MQERLRHWPAADNMRIVAGVWRGRKLVAPPGLATRPTADRVRQALFDMITHAEWGGRGSIEGVSVLDVFAGTGALGLEALSRGAASACFIESDAAALQALRANVALCKAEDRVEVVAGDALATGHHRPRIPAARSSPVQGLSEWSGTGGDGRAARLVFLDPPYAQNLVPRALASLREAGRIGPDALIVAETGRDEAWQPEQELLADRRQGAARILVFRAG
jgi:16S rRNA (guanine966-N2)-methyltransferase